MKNNKGFTLIEIILAIAIFSMMISIIYVSFFGSINTMNSCEDSLKLYQTARLIFERMTKEINCAFISSANENIAFIGVDGIDRGSPSDTLNFTSTFYSETGEGVKEGGLSEIGYFCAFESPEKGLLFWRKDTPPDEDPEEGGMTLELSEQINGLNFSYYNGSSWQEDWDSRDNHLLPKFVSVKITLPDTNEETVTFSTIINIPLGG